ncbi:TetR/AcrR family transcriptional regulator [Sphingomonas sp.]|uniref:TetR/AcrR family transcriptional regulator n=1 Tax=Sphingomonas sp. TaxID=28214 RepID=UPI000DB2A8D2|nr:TetR/AcrR family transcriptional regulator [Sphingomonas sp.]PZU09026.1 MAG: TetR/AcrR family transcriptional regulator [Sphingomonas sp.]
MPTEAAFPAVAPPRGRRPKDMAGGRQELLAAAICAFSHDGFERADLRGIASAAGVSQNLIRVHFGSKTQLWNACLDAITKSASGIISDISRIASDESRSVYDRLCDAIPRIVYFYSDHPYVRDFVVRHAADRSERSTLVTEQLIHPAYESCRTLYEAGIAQGIIRASHPALFFALLSAAANQPASFPTVLRSLAPEIPEDAARILIAETIIETLLHGEPCPPQR